MLEHNYVLPTKSQIRADVEALALWLEMVGDWLHPQVIMAGLSFGELSRRDSSKPRRITTLSGTFEKSQANVSFFSDSKNTMRVITPQGRSTTTKFSALSWKELVRAQSKHTNSERAFVVDRTLASRMLRAYAAWTKTRQDARFSVRSA